MQTDAVKYIKNIIAENDRLRSDLEKHRARFDKLVSITQEIVNEKRALEARLK